jgi:Arc/MetJ family transcription regulator
LVSKKAEPKGPAFFAYASIIYTDAYMSVARTTLNLDEDLLREARRLTGIEEKTALIHTALRELIARESARRLAALGGSMPNAAAGRRRRSA